MESVLFYLFAAISLAAGLMVITRRNPVTAALYLVLAFFCLAGIYVLMDAFFLAAVQVAVYAGAIMVLFLFVIMLLNLSPSGLTRIDRPRLKVLGLGASLAFVAIIVAVAIGSESWTGMKTENTPELSALTLDLSDQLFNYHVLPFEVASVLLLVAIVGAVALTKKKL